MQIDLCRDEHFLICVLRHFRFLRSLGYIIEGMLIYHREVGITYQNRSIKRTIDIGFEYGSGIRIVIWGKRRVFSTMMGVEVCDTYKEHSMLSNLPKPDEVREEDFDHVLKQYAMFLQQQLLPIIKGTEWV